MIYESDLMEFGCLFWARAALAWIRNPNLESRITRAAQPGFPHDPLYATHGYRPAAASEFVASRHLWDRQAAHVRWFNFGGPRRAGQQPRVVFAAPHVVRLRRPRTSAALQIREMLIVQHTRRMNLSPGGGPELRSTLPLCSNELWQGASESLCGSDPKKEIEHHNCGFRSW